MNQFIPWTSLCKERLRCNLQHLHAVISKDVAKTWNISELESPCQLVFGKPAGPPRGAVDKQFAPLEPRVKVYGKKA